MAVSRTSSAPELLVQLRRDGAEPLARQLEQQLREAVRSERLAPDAILPSSRALAAEVGVARGVVVAAYEQLVAEGYLVEHALRRYGQPEEIAATASFLLSSDASFVSGQAIAVDGGYTAGRDHGITKMLGMS